MAYAEIINTSLGLADEFVRLLSVMMNASSLAYAIDGSHNSC